jgi:hypothetical protein
VLGELRPGLWRWTARHPDAVDDLKPGRPADWPPDVGCVACAALGTLVVIDPLVPGDRLHGEGAGGVRLCPPPWLNHLPTGVTIDGLRVALSPIRDLPVEMVLVSHGDPMLRDGARAIERAPAAGA